MGKLAFMPAMIKSFAEGRFINRAWGFILRVLAILVVVAGAIRWVPLWSYTVNYSTGGIIGLVLFQLIFIIAIYMVAHALLIRARDINELPQSDYMVMKIVSVLLKTIGEIMASSMMAGGFAGGLMIWFVGYNARYILYEMGTIIPLMGRLINSGIYAENMFVGGLLFLIGGILLALFILLLSYLFSEILLATADIAINTKKICAGHSDESADGHLG